MEVMEVLEHMVAKLKKQLDDKTTIQISAKEFVRSFAIIGDILGCKSWRPLNAQGWAIGTFTVNIVPTFERERVAKLKKQLDWQAEQARSLSRGKHSEKPFSDVIEKKPNRSAAPALALHGQGFQECREVG